MSRALAFLLFVSTAAAAEDWQTIFNGKDLAGWDGEAGCWSVEDGAITGQTTPERPLRHHSYIIWRGGEVADFELQLKFRVSGRHGNSGVQYRSRDLGGHDVGGCQCNIEVGRAGSTAVLEEMKGRGGHLAEIGQIVRFSADGVREVVGSTGNGDEINRSLIKDGWNDLTIRAEGPRLQHWLNGRLAVDVTDLQTNKAAQAGILALQLHTGPPMKVQFKNVRLRRLTQVPGSK
jgi:hypothetical protein